jgi:hypothetical protein
LITSRLNVSNLSLTQQRAITIFYFISGILYYIGSTVNPIFYHLFSRKYRLACIRTMKKIIHCKRYHYRNIPQRHKSLPVIHYAKLPRTKLKATEHIYQSSRSKKTSFIIGNNKKTLLRLSLPAFTLERNR